MCVGRDGEKEDGQGEQQGWVAGELTEAAQRKTKKGRKVIWIDEPETGQLQLKEQAGSDPQLHHICIWSKPEAQLEKPKEDEICFK